VAVAVGVTAYIIWRADPSRVGAALAAVSWPWIAAACALVLVDRALMAYRWIALLATLAPERRPPVGVALRVFFVSTFVGTFLPQSVGADAVRTWSLARQTGVAASEALASVLMDRLLGVLAIVIAAAAGALAVVNVLEDAWIRLAFALATAGCLAGAAVVFSPRVDDLLRRGLVARAPHALRGPLERILAAIRAYEAHRGALALVLAASVAVQVLRILQAWMLGLALGIQAGPGAYFAFVPMILLVMLLPITINGLGTSQWAFETLFARVGTPAPEALALSILFVALGVVGNLPGAVLYVTTYPRR
jgi:uncharacterized protein (TIRG00374 family)